MEAAVEHDGAQWFVKDCRIVQIHFHLALRGMADVVVVAKFECQVVSGVAMPAGVKNGQCVFSRYVFHAVYESQVVVVDENFSGVAFLNVDFQSVVHVFACVVIQF